MDVNDCEESETPNSGAGKKNEENVAPNIENSISAADSDISGHEDEVDYCDDDVSDHYEEDDDDDDCMFDDEDDDDYMFDNEDDDCGQMQSLFDDVDLPPGVEISLPWMDSAISKSGQSASNSSPSTFTLVSGTTSSSDQVHKPEEVAASSALSEDGNLKEAARERYEGFKGFDIVDRPSLCIGMVADKKWLKKVQEEWKVLENSLPDTIFVRVSEKRMDFLRAVIIGPAGTSYHDGLFTFDAIFPAQYPSVPPMVFYYSGSLRLNPNLYDCGIVCLSLLNTWCGKRTENWIPGKSTMLQVLVSIQALILNAKPFFNEPGYKACFRGAKGVRKSKKYNNKVFILSLKTMMYTLRRPPQHFEALVVGHFRARANDIMAACKAYIEGVVVGCPLNSEADEGECPSHFKQGVKKMMSVLIKLFTIIGAKDLEHFLSQTQSAMKLKTIFSFDLNR